MWGGNAPVRRFLQPYLIILLFAIALAALRAGDAHAVAGDLDPSFGVGGKAVPDLSALNHVYLNALALQDDGKIVCGGGYEESMGGNWDFIVFRLLANGALDTGFGVGGWMTTSFESLEEVWDLAIQSDGKIVAIGNRSGIYPDPSGVMARYNSNGTLDTSFGTDGKVHSGYGNASWQAVTLQADGKIVVAGKKDGHFTVARFTTGGVLDTTFNLTGIATVVIGDASGASDVAVDSNGKIVAVGAGGSSGSPGDFAVARFNDDGTLNLSFGTAGITTVDLAGASSDAARKLAIDGSGKIYVAGEADGGSDGMAAVVRLTSSGVLDTTFGATGKLTYQVSNEDMHTTGLVLDPQGRPVLGGHFSGYSVGPYDSYSWIIRFTTDGTLDHGFGVDGLWVSTLGAGTYSLYAGVHSADRGLLLFGGQTEYGPTISRHQTDDHSKVGNDTWWWSDPERNDNYLVEPGLVTIHANAAQNLWSCQRLQAPMFYRDLPAGKHWSVTTLLYVPSQNQDTMAGLMLWNGAESGAVHTLYVGLADVLGTPWVIAAGSIPENCAAALPYASYAMDLVVVSIVRSGNDYTFSYAPPFGAWVEMGTITTAADFSKVGFMAKSWATNDIEAQFSFFSLVKPGAASSLDLLLSP